MRIERFSGKQEDWDDVSFSFKRACRAMDVEAYDLMSKAEHMNDQEVAELEKDIDVQQTSGELFDILCQYVSGDALVVVKSAPDCEGLLAWLRLHRKYSPRTLARGVKLLSEIVSPARASELKDVEVYIVKWEEKLRRMRQMYGNELTKDIKMAIFTNMMPASIQDFVYTNITRQMEYEELKDKVMALVSNKVVAGEASGRMPMDVGQVQGDRGQGAWGEVPGGHDQAIWEENDVDGVNVQCHRCGGWGHMIKESVKR